MRRALLFLAACMLATAAAPAPPAPAVQAEIDALLVRLESSGCAFGRNGTWGTAAEAKAHLLRKLKHVENSAELPSAEQFIELVASSSSTTGKPYLVRCGNETPVQSGAWLLAQLKAMRSPAPVKRALP